MTSQPPAGWYPDPSGAPGQRWWDGGAWSTNVAPAPPQPVGSPTVPVPVGAVSGAPSPYMYPAGPAQGYSRASTHGRNHYALITFAVVAAYLVVAFATRVVFFGILPLGLAFRSKRDGEPLAVLAIAAAVLSVVVAASLIFGH